MDEQLSRLISRHRAGADVTRAQIITAITRAGLDPVAKFNTDQKDVSDQLTPVPFTRVYPSYLRGTSSPYYDMVSLYVRGSEPNHSIVAITLYYPNVDGIINAHLDVFFQMFNVAWNSPSIVRAKLQAEGRDTMHQLRPWFRKVKNYREYMGRLPMPMPPETGESMEKKWTHLLEFDLPDSPSWEPLSNPGSQMLAYFYTIAELLRGRLKRVRDSHGIYDYKMTARYHGLLIDVAWNKLPDNSESVSIFLDAEEDAVYPKIVLSATIDQEQHSVALPRKINVLVQLEHSIDKMEDVFSHDLQLLRPNLMMAELIRIHGVLKRKYLHGPGA